MSDCCLAQLIFQMEKLALRGARLIHVSTGQPPRSSDAAAMEVGHLGEGQESLL